MSQYKDRLRKLVAQDLPSLRNDLSQATTTLYLRPVVERMFSMLQLVIYDLLTSGPQESRPEPAAPLAASPAPVLTPQQAAPLAAAPAPVLTPQPSGTLPDLPDLPPLDAPATPGNSVQVAGMPPVEVVPGVLNVVVTPTGPARVGPNGELEPIPPTT